MKKVFGIFTLLALAAAVYVFPGVASAQYVAGGTSWFDFANLIYAVTKWAGPILVLVASLIFSYNIVMYVVSGDDAKKKKDALVGVGYSVLGIFAMLSLWALIAFLSSTFKVGVGGSLSQDLIPQVQTCPPFGTPGTTPGC